jgi:hypothetical protein
MKSIHYYEALARGKYGILSGMMRSGFGHPFSDRNEERRTLSMSLFTSDSSSHEAGAA